MQELQQALKELDADRTQDALERLAEAQKELREALERSRELFRRAALEGDLANLSQESRSWRRSSANGTRRSAASDSARAAQAERELAARADSLAAAIDRVRHPVGDRRQQHGSTPRGTGAKQAGQQMHQAASASQQGQRGPARQQGEEAERSLEPLSEQLRREREGMQQEWRQEVVAALDQALAETSRLAERELSVQEQLRNGGDPNGRVRAEQGAIEEGVQRLLEQVRKAGGKNALGASRDRGRARRRPAPDAANARGDLHAPRPTPGKARSRRAARWMRSTPRRISCSARGATCRARARARDSAEALERMAQLAQQQGGLGQQGAGMLPDGGERRASASSCGSSGCKQRALAEELQKLRGGGNLPGAGEMADEAKDLAKRLEGGRLDRQIVERQERLFRRMLDAGRTLQGREEDERKERQSTTATDDSVHLPPALRAKLAGDDDRLRVPRGRSCSSSRPRSAGWWWTISAGCRSRRAP